MTKTCPRCKITKPRDDFNKRSASKDGLQIRCRQCQCEIEKTYSKGHGAEVRRIGHRRKYQRQKDRQPEKLRARNIVSYALLSGRMKRLPCEVCGERKTHAHHEDYSKPLDVKWLCKKHHDEHHREEREARRKAVNLLDRDLIKSNFAKLKSEVNQILRDISRRRDRVDDEVDWDSLSCADVSFRIEDDFEGFRATIAGSRGNQSLFREVDSRLEHMGWKQARSC